MQKIKAYSLPFTAKGDLSVTRVTFYEDRLCQENKVIITLQKREVLYSDVRTVALQRIRIQFSDSMSLILEGTNSAQPVLQIMFSFFHPTICMTMLDILFKYLPHASFDELSKQFRDGRVDRNGRVIR